VAIHPAAAQGPEAAQAADPERQAMTSSRRFWVALSVAALPLAACGTSPSRASAAPAHPPGCTPASGMQLPARISVGTGVRARAWAKALLGAMDDPGTSADTASMLAWFSAEDGGKAAGQQTDGAGENNPLNLTADSGDTVGAVGTEPSGAGPAHPGNLDFSSPDYGVAATAEVIVTKYPVINQALLNGKGLTGNPAVSGELAEWSGGGYSSLKLSYNGKDQS
jgi:hypothetical protein